MGKKCLLVKLHHLSFYPLSTYLSNIAIDVILQSESARKDVLRALGDAGFDMAVSGLGERFGYDNMTCFHSSYMGMSHCDKSKMHSGEF